MGRRRGRWVSRLVDNRPLLLMAGSRVIASHLDQARVTEADLYAKLRLAGITHREQLFAVVLETTGDVSVLKRGDHMELELLEGVRGLEHLSSISNRGAALPVARSDRGRLSPWGGYAAICTGELAIEIICDGRRVDLM